MVPPPSNLPCAPRAALCLGLAFAAALVGQGPGPSGVPVGDAAGAPTVASQVERHGITWRFAEPCVVGAFANGDPWVIGPVRVVAIAPPSAVRNGRVVNGAMVDPEPGRLLQGYDSALLGPGRDAHYTAVLDVAAAIAGGRALDLSPGSSLVSVVSRVEATPALQTAAVLTSVASLPAPDAFRPPYVGGAHAERRVAELDLAALGRVAPAPGAPQIDAIAGEFERLWLDHFPADVAALAHPRDNLPDFGRDFAAAVGTAALLLNCDLPAERKRALLIRFVQLGIDLHAAVRGGCRWPGNGGYGHGRKLPILFAGRLLQDARMLAVGRDFPVAPVVDGGIGASFGEDGQTFFVRETSPGVWNHGCGGFGREHDGLAEWGTAHALEASRDDARWNGDPDRTCCTANAWVGEALAARMMGLQAAWNHPAFFAYVDRYVAVAPAEPWQRAWVAWHGAMWDTYRSNY